MEIRKLLIADGSEEFRAALTHALPGNYQIRTCSDGQDALSLLRSFHPDILVLDLMLPGLDGISLLHTAASEEICPVVLATCRFLTEYMAESVDSLGISYVMIKPCDIPATVNRIQDLSQRIHAPVLSVADTRTLATNLLRSLGVPTKLHGYTYLREGILLMIKDPHQTITKELYPAVGALCQCSADQVERSIRTAIKNAWMSREDSVWQAYFPPGPDGRIHKPTNAAFLTRLADSLAFQQDLQI